MSARKQNGQSPYGEGRGGRWHDLTDSPDVDRYTKKFDKELNPVNSYVHLTNTGAGYTFFDSRNIMDAYPNNGQPDMRYVDPQNRARKTTPQGKRKIETRKMARSTNVRDGGRAGTNIKDKEKKKKKITEDKRRIENNTLLQAMNTIQSKKYKNTVIASEAKAIIQQGKFRNSIKWTGVSSQQQFTPN